MSADNRTVATDALATLGTIITENEKRDAIHLAVENVIAGQIVMPGDRVGLRDGKAYRERFNKFDSGVKALGIVDPFLEEGVMPGQRFWLIVFPRQINSLRHVWEAPGFSPSELSAPAVAMQGDPIEKSVAWLTDFGDESGLSYSALIEAAHEHLRSGDYYIIRGTDTPDRVFTDRREFWKHFEIVTGEKIDDDRRDETFISCSC